MDDRQPKFTAGEKEARSKLAIRKVHDGRTQGDVADFLGIHPVTVAKWMKAYHDGGRTLWPPSRCPAAPAS